MLLVPIGVVLLARSFIPDFNQMGALVRAAPGPRPSPTTRNENSPTVGGVVVDVDGNPVEAATVRLVSPGPSGEVLAETTTAAGGSFVFSKLPASEALVVADHEPQGIVSSNVLRADGGPTADLLLVLSSAEAIHGNVVDTDGHPVAGAVVSALGVRWKVAAATSDGAGTFRMASVPHEATSLMAVARGYTAGRALLTLRLQSTEPAEHEVQIKLVAAPPIDGEVIDPDGQPIAARVVACDGEPSVARTTSAPDGSFGLPPSTTGCMAIAEQDDFAASDPVAVEGRRLTLRLKAGGAIEGVVVDERGSGVSPVRVGIESFAPARGRAAARAGTTSFDDARGAFRLDKLAPGTYVLTGSTAGKPPARSEPVEVTAGAVTRGVRIVLLAGGVVAGRVYDEKHAPLAGVDMSFDFVSSAIASTAHATSDAQGAYRLEGAPSVTFTLQAKKPGYRSRMVAGLRVSNGATLLEDVTLTGADGGGSLELGGIGASLSPSREGVTIRQVFDGDPAERAGLRAGDRVVRVDGESTDGMSMADVLQRLRGEPGTTVGVTVQRGGSTVDVVVVRALVVR